MIHLNAGRIILSNTRDGTKYLPATPVQGSVVFHLILDIVSLLSLLRECPFHRRGDGGVMAQMPCRGQSAQVSQQDVALPGARGARQGPSLGSPPSEQ